MKIHTLYPPDTEEEICLKKHISRIQEDARRAAQPYLDRLVAIHALKVPRIFIEDEEWTT